MKRELSDLVAYVERIRYAFYVVGEPAAVKEAMASGHEVFEAARSTLKLAQCRPSVSLFDEENPIDEN